MRERHVDMCQIVIFPYAMIPINVTFTTCSQETQAETFVDPAARMTPHMWRSVMCTLEIGFTTFQRGPLVRKELRLNRKSDSPQRPAKINQ